MWFFEWLLGGNKRRSGPPTEPTVGPVGSIRTLFLALFAVSLIPALALTACGENDIDRVQKVQAKVNAGGSALVSWDEVPIKRDLIGYRVYWSKDKELPQTGRQMAQTAAASTSHTIGGLAAGQWYVRVRAVFMRTYNSIGSSSQKEQEGPWSETVTLTVP